MKEIINKEWYNSENPNSVLVHSVTYTPEYDLTTPRTNVFKYTDMDDNLAKKTRNLPVLYEHQDEHHIGQVVDSFVDYKRHLHSLMLLNKNENALSHVIPGLYNNSIPGASMGTKVQLETDDYAKIKSVEPEEISLVGQPDRKGCNIQGTWMVPKSNEERFIQQVYDNVYKKYK